MGVGEILVRCSRLSVCGVETSELRGGGARVYI
jgi:hypothetical protein